jgi:PBP1b-binding outer membrane lipoprotein LpoB
MQLEQIKNSIFVTNNKKMKRVVSLLVFALLLNGCDDGDLIQEDISFEDVATQNCTTNNIIYKLKDTEALILEVVGFTFPTETKSQELDISASNRVLYRFYNGTVTSSTICETIPPATPIVVDQWTTSGGKIVINTTAVKTTNTTDNSTKITGYNHNITFKNITFVKSNGTQVYETFPFGDYVISATPLPFAFNKTLEQCSSSKQLYDYNSSEALILDIDPALIVNEATPINTPRTGLISDTKNKLTYRLFSGLLTGAYFCNTTFPATPAVSEEWIAVAGVANESGIVEVTTATLGTGFKHTVVLKKAKMKKGSSDFILGDNYIYGELLTTN